MFFNMTLDLVQWGCKYQTLWYLNGQKEVGYQIVRYLIIRQLNHLNTRQMDPGLEFKWLIEEQVNLPFEIQTLIFFLSLI